MQNALCMLLFTSTNNYFFQRVMCSDRPYTYTINIQITDSFHAMHDGHKEQDIVSMQCTMATKSRTEVLFFVGIQWVRHPVERKYFLEK